MLLLITEISVILEKIQCEGNLLSWIKTYGSIQSVQPTEHSQRTRLHKTKLIRTFSQELGSNKNTMET